MYYIIQENLFREEGHAKLIAALDKFKLQYEMVKVKPFIEEVEFESDRKDIIVFGSLKLSRLSKKYGWTPGTMITDNHDYNVYSKYYKDELLNYDSRIFKLSDDFEWNQDIQFIRPCTDSKIFTGKVFDKDMWEDTKKFLLHPDHVTSATPDSLIQVANPKKITQEIRFWVVDGKIVTQSTYRRGTFLVYDNIVDQDAVNYVNKMINVYQLSKHFVIDVGLTENGWKIIECGSIGCAGFYDADMQKLIMALETLYMDLQETCYPEVYKP